MTINQLDWQTLLPILTPTDVEKIGEHHADDAAAFAIVDKIQARLNYGLTQFCQHQTNTPFMLMNAEENYQLFTFIAEWLTSKAPSPLHHLGTGYKIENNRVTTYAISDRNDPFAVNQYCHHEIWIEEEQLFGCVKKPDHYEIYPGILHRLNGGVLILSVKLLLQQPKLWLRLKNMVITQRLQLISSNDKQGGPSLNIPDIPLNLRLIIIGNHIDLSEFEELEPEIVSHAAYGEFENNLSWLSPQQLADWSDYVRFLSHYYHFFPIRNDLWPVLVHQAIRYTSEKSQLPLSPIWLKEQFHLAWDEDLQSLTGEKLSEKITKQQWQYSYLYHQSRYDITSGQIQIQTKGAVIGQINALSVLMYPSHPQPFGEPSRITCVAHIGDGEIIDVERKVELGGNLHAKGMIIMQAFLMSELKLEHPFPFSASMVFEQSYSEVDGDSASLAELCALISALSLQPIYQSIAVTGSVDQFGQVQPVGGVNEKIESFFDICQHHGLNKQQGVIIPKANINHLCLNDDVVTAVRNRQFSIWAVEKVGEALALLTGLPYDDHDKLNLLSIIHERINITNAQDKRRVSWWSRWVSLFHTN